MDELSIQQRATKLLEGDDGDKDDLRFFLSRLLQIQEDQGRDASRAVLRGAGLGAVFIILTHSKLLEAELLGMKIHDISPLRLIIPVAMMLMVLRAVTVLRLSIFYRRIFDQVAGKHLPNWQASGLIPLLSPWRGPMSTHASPIRLDANEHPGVDRLHQAMRIVDAWAGTAAIAGFQIYAFVILFRDPRIPTIAAAVSLGTSLILISFVAAYLWFVRLSRHPSVPGGGRGV
ncbi:hypothetical protein [Micromonospora sp. NPDC001898]|uniref:hypothetical protein n=1 Tax=Micromonospora sp. NPDC001898 TaxID=3364221 RepID=UPI00368F0B58